MAAAAVTGHEWWHQSLTQLPEAGVIGRPTPGLALEPCVRRPFGGHPSVMRDHETKPSSPAMSLSLSPPREALLSSLPSGHPVPCPQAPTRHRLRSRGRSCHSRVGPAAGGCSVCHLARGKRGASLCGSRGVCHAKAGNAGHVTPSGLPVQELSRQCSLPWGSRTRRALCLEGSSFFPAVT